ncbi:MAG: mannose-6-phosphate isomerase, class I [Chitinophagaceae bacterium]|nr:mannose-6-phosphate isomerase, class I [Chitinophagaceae bacterium]
MQGIFPLIGKIMHYEWGGFSFIPSLLNLTADSKTPYAEYWLGTHPSAPSLVQIPQQQRELTAFVSQLPFLLKAIDVREMLSIQVHPDKKQAQEGFARENQAGIPISAPHRNYKDDNHKPELIVALSDFYALQGFKSPDLLEKTLNEIPELKPLYPVFSQQGYKGLYRHVMEMAQQDVNSMLVPLAEKLLPLAEQGKIPADSQEYYAAMALKKYWNSGNPDKGILSVFFMNLVHLKPGEGLFQPAGMIHAYLKGYGVEVMASSDNVLRGGLTPKHIDIPELLKTLNYYPVSPQVIYPQPQSQYVSVYHVPVSDFSLSKIRLHYKETLQLTSKSTQILMRVSGIIRCEPGNILLQPGNTAMVIFPDTVYSLTGESELTEMFTVTANFPP